MRTLNQYDHKHETSLGYIVSPCWEEVNSGFGLSSWKIRAWQETCETGGNILRYACGEHNVKPNILAWCLHTWQV